MAGAVLTQEDKLIIGTQRALGKQIEQNQLLSSRLHTAEAQIKRLLDLQERTQARLDAAQAQLNGALDAVLAKDRELGAMAGELADARDWAQAWKMAASKWFGRLAPEPEAKP